MSLRERCALVIPTLDAGARLAGVLEAGGQDWRRRAVLIDNGAPAEAMNAVRDRWPEVVIVESGANHGFARAVNMGIRAARQRGDAVVVLINDDVVVAASALDALAHAVLDDAQVGSAAGVLLQPGAVLVDTAGVRCDRALGAVDVGRGRAPAELQAEPAPLGPSGGLGAYRLVALEQVGDFDEGFFAYYEDVDMALRLSACGWRCVLQPRAVADHVGSATLGWRSLEKAVTVGRSRGRIARKYGVHRQIRAWPWLALEICAGLALGIEHRSLAPLRARAAGFLSAARVSTYPSELVDDGSARAAVVERLARRYRRRHLAATAAE